MRPSPAMLSASVLVLVTCSQQGGASQSHGSAPEDGLVWPVAAKSREAWLPPGLSGGKAAGDVGWPAAVLGRRTAIVPGDSTDAVAPWSRPGLLAGDVFEQSGASVYVPLRAGLEPRLAYRMGRARPPNGAPDVLMGHAPDPGMLYVLERDTSTTGGVPSPGATARYAPLFVRVAGLSMADTGLLLAGCLFLVVGFLEAKRLARRGRPVNE